MKTRFNPVLAKATQDKIANNAFKQTPIPPGMVRFERHDYSYGQQGQVSLVGYTIKDVPELEAINWIAYGTSFVTWPNGGVEFFDMRVTPCRHECHAGYGAITRNDGSRATGTLSKLPNVFVEYYGARLITPAERATFAPHVFEIAERARAAIAKAKGQP